MTFGMFIEEQMYILFSTYYYEVFLYKGKVQVGKIIQALSFSPNYIVDFKRKLAFHILKDRGFIKGHKIILHYDIDRAIPLVEIEEEEITEINSSVIKIKKLIKLSGSITKEEKEKSNPKQISESNYPPHLLFEINNAHFVTKTLAQPKVTDWTLIIGAVIVAVIIIAFMAIVVFGFR
jgi:hypothetical protein